MFERMRAIMAAKKLLNKLHKQGEAATLAAALDLFQESEEYRPTDAPDAATLLAVAYAEINRWEARPHVALYILAVAVLTDGPYGAEFEQVRIQSSQYAQKILEAKDPGDDRYKLMVPLATALASHGWNVTG